MPPAARDVIRPAVGDVICSFLFYMVDPFARYMSPRGTVRWLFITTTVHSALRAALRGYKSNPALMVSQYFAGRLGNDATALSLVIRTFSQVLGGLIGAAFVFSAIGTAGGNGGADNGGYAAGGNGDEIPRNGNGMQHHQPRLHQAQVVTCCMYFFVSLSIDDFQRHWMFEFIGNEVFGKFLIDCAFKLVLTVVRTKAGAGERSIPLNPAHRLGKTLIESTVRREDFALDWFLIICVGIGVGGFLIICVGIGVGVGVGLGLGVGLVCVSLGGTFINATTRNQFFFVQFLFGVFTFILIPKIMDEGLINAPIMRDWFYPFIFAVSSGLAFRIIITMIALRIIFQRTIVMHP